MKRFRRPGRLSNLVTSNFSPALKLVVFALCVALGLAIVYTNYLRPPASFQSPVVTTSATQIPRQEVLSWSIKISTGGGITGKGEGGINITSDAEVEAHQPKGLFNPSCKSLDPNGVLHRNAHLSERELDALSQAVSSAQPSAWSREYISPTNPDACCDQIGTRLELEYRNRDGSKLIYTADWYDSSSSLLPTDLARTYQEAMRIKHQMFRDCHN